MFTSPVSRFWILGIMYGVYTSSWLLFGLLFAACGGTENETADPQIEQIRLATQMVFDLGSIKEQMYSGVELREFLDRFEPDTFEYGPRRVRLVSGCRGGSIRINDSNYPISLCQLKSGRGCDVLSIAMGSRVVRMLEKRD